MLIKYLLCCPITTFIKIHHSAYYMHSNIPACSFSIIFVWFPLSLRWKVSHICHTRFLSDKKMFWKCQYRFWTCWDVWNAIWWRRKSAASLFKIPNFMYWTAKLGGPQEKTKMPKQENMDAHNETIFGMMVFLGAVRLR